MYWKVFTGRYKVIFWYWCLLLVYPDPERWSHYRSLTLRPCGLIGLGRWRVPEALSKCSESRNTKLEPKYLSLPLGRGGRVVERRTFRDRSSKPPPPFRSLSNFVYPTFPVSFGRDGKNRCLVGVGSFYLDMLGEVKVSTQGNGKYLLWTH